jgi:hypothetical protein
VACSQSKTIELNNSHLPHRKEKSCSHFWKLLLLQYFHRKGKVVPVLK